MRPVRLRCDLGRRDDLRVFELFGESAQPVGRGEGLEVCENVQYPFILRHKNPLRLVNASLKQPYHEHLC
jgi:hypothetical protein